MLLPRWASDRVVTWSGGDPASPREEELARQLRELEQAREDEKARLEKRQEEMAGKLKKSEEEGKKTAKGLEDRLTAEAERARSAEEARTRAEDRAKGAEKAADDAKAKEKAASEALDKAKTALAGLEKKLADAERATSVTKLWYVIKNPTKVPIRYETRAYSWLGKWSKWEEHAIEPGQSQKLVAPPGSVWVEARYDLRRKPNGERSIYAQTFLSERDPAITEIDCVYTFRFSPDGKSLHLKEASRK
jgi:hypothetical protein